MKKIILYLALIVMIFELSGCGSFVAPSDGTDIINRSLVQISDAKSLEYSIKSEETVKYGDKENSNWTKAEIKQTVNPYASYSKSDHSVIKTDGTKTRTLIETYWFTQDGTMDFYVRNSMEDDPANEPVLSDWQRNPIDNKDAVELAVQLRQKTKEAYIALIRSNLKSFKRVDDAEAYVFEGSISHDTVLSAYRDYMRALYIKAGVVNGPDNPTKEDLKRELASRPEFQSDFTKLAYSEVPTPVTLIINKENSQLEMVIVDEKSALQAILEQEIPKLNLDLGTPEVAKSEYTIEITGINTVKALAAPIE